MRTTIVTGVLNDWAQALMQYLSWLRQQPRELHVRQTMRKSMKQASFRHLLLLAGIWGWYVLGAICASALELHMALFSLAFPCSFSRRSLFLTCSDRCNSQKRPSLMDEEEPL